MHAHLALPPCFARASLPHAAAACGHAPLPSPMPTFMPADLQPHPILSILDSVPPLDCTLCIATNTGQVALLSSSPPSTLCRGAPRIPGPPPHNSTQKTPLPGPAWPCSAALRAPPAERPRCLPSALAAQLPPAPLLALPRPAVARCACSATPLLYVPLACHSPPSALPPPLLLHPSTSGCGRCTCSATLPTQPVLPGLLCKL